MTYTCKICGTTSDVSEFYKGVTSRCKECHKKGVRENRAGKANYYREYDAKRYKDDPRVKKRHERYRKSDAGKIAFKKAHKKWLDQNQEKRACHIILGNAVRDGKVKKPNSCQKCGSTGCRIEGHHEDYTRPLDVSWVCRQCHADIHK